MEETADLLGSNNGEKKIMLVAFDDSEHSFYALKWTIEHFFAGSNNGRGPLRDEYKLVILHASAAPPVAIGLGGPAAAVVLPKVEAELSKISGQVIEKARGLCLDNSVFDVTYEEAQGDARNVLCDAVERLQANMLVLGSHGYGAVKRTVLGSVSDYCAHHARCTVMIVKKPKQKN